MHEERSKCSRFYVITTTTYGEFYKSTEIHWNWPATIAINIFILSIMLFIIGSVLRFAFIGPYEEVQKYRNVYMAGVCTAGPNYRATDNPDSYPDQVDDHITYFGVIAYIFNTTTNLTNVYNDVRLIKPSLTYKFVDVTYGLVLEPYKNYFVASNKTCHISPVKKNGLYHGIGSIDYEDTIVRNYRSGLVLLILCGAMILAILLPVIIEFIWFLCSNVYDYINGIRLARIQRDINSGVVINIDSIMAVEVDITDNTSSV